MNKSELIKAVAAKAEVSNALAAKVLDAALEAGAEALRRGERVQLVGFLTAAVAEKPARKAKNPRTGAIIEVPARKVVKVKAAANLL